MRARRRDLLRRHEHADAVADLQHQVGRRHEVDVVAPDMQHLDRNAVRQRQIGQRHAGQARLETKKR